MSDEAYDRNAVCPECGHKGMIFCLAGEDYFVIVCPECDYIEEKELPEVYDE